MRWAEILTKEDVFPMRAARIRLWETFYKGLSSNRGLCESLKFMATFSKWTISECKAVVLKYKSFGQAKTAISTTKPTALAVSVPTKQNVSRKTLEVAMEIDMLAPGKAQKKKTNPAPAPAGASFSGKCFGCQKHGH